MANDPPKFAVIEGGKSDQDKEPKLRIFDRDKAASDDETYQKDRVREIRKYLRKKQGREPTDEEVMNILLAIQDILPSE